MKTDSLIKKKSFVHLRVHSENSLLSSLFRIPSIIEIAQQNNMSSVALTDDGNMFGMIKFYQKAKAMDIKPIIGLNIYLTTGLHTKKDKSLQRKTFRMVLVAKNNQGYYNLMKISKISYLDGFYYVPRVDWSILKKYSEGLICLSGFSRGPLGSAIMNQQNQDLEDYLEQILAIYGKENFYLELQRHSLPERELIIKEYQKLSIKHSLSLVATNDVYYPYQKDSATHDVLLCLKSGSTREDTNRLKFPSEEFYFKSTEEMCDLFQDIPDAITNTQLIADRCNVTIDLNSRYLPKFKNTKDLSSAEYLKELCYDAVSKKYPNPSKEVYDRLTFELDVIIKMGFPDYFLVVSDFVAYSRSQSIAVGPGRGSAAGSIVSYLLNITALDPLKYGLLFERFLNPERISMPDIDIDFCKNNRQKIIHYITKKYGQDCVSQIITFGTMAAKMVIRDVGRVLNIPLETINLITKLIPTIPNITLKKALAEVPELKNHAETNYRELFQIAFNLEGLVRQPGIHAAGLVLSGTPLDTITPLYKNSTEITTQYEASCLEDLGLLKMDILGLKNLTVISDTCLLIKKTQNIKLDLDTIDLNDEKTYRLLSSGETIGVFQLESEGMRQLAKKMKVETFEVIVALLALYRPGPLAWADDFIKRKHGKQRIKYAHPLLKEILNETYGIMLYQEQVMQSVSVLAGFTIAEADLLRRAMGKKKEKIMESQREKFVEGCFEKNKISSKLAHEIFDMIYKFAGYGFNKSHSVAYSLISYQTAFLKSHYPLEYMSCLITHSMDTTEKVALLMQECDSMDILILPPDVNQSNSVFTVVDKGIRFGLSAIKNIGEGAITEIQSDRETNGEYKSFMDFALRMNTRVVNKRVFESLIKSGAMDSFSLKRSQLMTILDETLDIAQREQEDKKRGQYSIFDLMDDQKKSQSTLTHPTIPQMDEWFQEELLRYEKELMGFYVSAHPLDNYREILSLCCTHGILDLDAEKEIFWERRKEDKKLKDIPVRLGGLISKIRVVTTRKKEQMAFFSLEDVNGTMSVIMFPRSYNTYHRYLVDNAIVLLDGKLSLNQTRDQLQIVAEKLIPIDDAPNFYKKKLHIAFSKNIQDVSCFKKMKDLFQKNNGSCSVMFLITSSDNQTVRILLDDPYRIRFTQDLKINLQDILGSSASIFFEKEACS